MYIALMHACLQLCREDMIINYFGLRVLVDVNMQGFTYHHTLYS